jgi:FkbM family methyltransferase
MSVISYAQNYEDVMLLRALRTVRCGFYIDVGAQDPVRDSVTKLFYEMGWRGINIEPVTHWFERLQADRPRDINLQLAVSDTQGQLHLFEVLDSGLSTSDEEFAKRHTTDGHSIKEFDVLCSTLDDILQQNQSGEIHFLKIDCEGGEAAALRGLSLTKFRPWIILLEATEPNSQKPAYAEWEPLLLNRGYHFVYQDGLNRFYVADEHAALDTHFSQPPNVFDDFVRANEATALNLLEIAQGELSAYQDAQRLALAEAEVIRLSKMSQNLHEENERREAALVVYRQKLEEASSQEEQRSSQMRDEIRRLSTFAENINLENERREAALIEHRRLLDETLAREESRAVQMQSEIDHWRTTAERLREANETCENALERQRQEIHDAILQEQQRSAQLLEEISQLRMLAENFNLESQRNAGALVENRRLLDETHAREHLKSVEMQIAIDHWKTAAERWQEAKEHGEAALERQRQEIHGAYLQEQQRSAQMQEEINRLRMLVENFNLETQRNEGALVENRRLLNEMIVREHVKAVEMQAAIDHWKTFSERLQEENAHHEVALNEHHRLLEDYVNKHTEHAARSEKEIGFWKAAAESLGAENQGRESLLASKSQLIAALEEELKALRLANASVMQQAVDARSSMEKLVVQCTESKYIAASLTSAIEASLEDRRQLERDVATLQKQALDRKSDLDEIFLSRSWRITKPFRRIASLRYRWRDRKKLGSSQIEDVELKYVSSDRDVIDGKGSERDEDRDIAGGAKVHDVHEILVGKNIEALNGLRRRLRKHNVQ